MNKVYRYEIPDESRVIGYGPYGAHNAFENSSKLLSDYCYLRDYMGDAHIDNHHPGIRYDIDDFDGCAHFCACPTLGLLKDWFAEFNKDLEELGFVIVEYTVSQFTLGYSRLQCVFEAVHVIEKRILV